METVDVGRLKFVASNLGVLWGLRQTAVGAFLLLAVAIFRFGPEWSYWLTPLLIIPAVFSVRRINAYYGSTFGKIEVGTCSPTRSILYILFGPVLAIVLMMIPPREGPIRSMGCTLIAYFFRTGKRWYYAVFGAMILGLSFWPGLDPWVAMKTYFWLLPLIAIVTGLLDHFLIVNSLPGLKGREHV